MDFLAAEVASNGRLTVNKATPSGICLPPRYRQRKMFDLREKERQKRGKKGYSIRCQTKLGLANDCQTSRDPRDKNAWPTKDGKLMRGKTRDGVRQKSALVEGVQKRVVVLTKTGVGERKRESLLGHTRVTSRRESLSMPETFTDKYSRIVGVEGHRRGKHVHTLRELTTPHFA